ncbi:uncharacterized protein LOC135086125 [Ostrinia nubilalis]|uniref:uncharacterized protein LOC135086125 n=1 Tax=Ostrinia nubilalis TaxID=29057 RepID=UPI0030824CEA
MEKNDDAASPYAACRHIKRTQPDISVDEAIVKTFSNDFRVLPLFEKKLFDYTRVRHYSLRRNRLLGCRWRRYIDTNMGRERNPFQFPKVDDFHFYNYHNRYAPSQSICKIARHHRQLAPGPGVDKYGQMPIPDDMHLRKTVGIAKKWV